MSKRTHDDTSKKESREESGEEILKCMSKKATEYRATANESDVQNEEHLEYNEDVYVSPLLPMASEIMANAENMLRDNIFEEYSVMTDTTAGLSPRSRTGEGIIDSALVDDFDPNLLRELGDIDQDPVEFGESLQADLATRFQKILLEGLKKETKEELIKKYPFPKNVPMAKRPALNPEIAAMLAVICKQRDKRLLTKQDQLGKAISALGKALTGLLKKTPDIPDIIRTLNDAGMLLSDSHFAETDTRRSVIMPLIDKSFTDSLKNRKRDTFLFAEKLGDLVKDSRGLKKTGQLMQPSASTNTNLNGKGPSSRGARQQRGGQTYRYYRGGGPRLATTASSAIPIPVSIFEPLASGYSTAAAPTGCGAVSAAGTSAPPAASGTELQLRDQSSDVAAQPQVHSELSKSSSNRIVSILGLFELSIGAAPRAEGASELAAAQLAVQHVNRRGLLLGYKLHLITNDTRCDPGVGVDRFFHALYTERESRMVMLLGSACSEVTESIAKIVPYWNIVQVSFGSTSPALSDRSEFPLFCRTVAPDSSHNPARIAFIRQFGWDTVTAFSQNEEVYSLAVNELVTQLEAANITCAASITFAESDFKEQLQQLKELDTRIIIGSFSQEMIPKIFCEAFKLGMWGAEYAWVVAGAPPRLRASPPCARAQLATALEGLVSVTAHRGIVGDAVSYSGLTNEMFHREMAAAGVPVSPYAPQTYDAVWAIALALSKAEQLWRSLDMSHHNGTLLKGGLKLGLSHFDYNRKDMAEEFLNQLSNLSFLGVSGPVSFNGADRIGTSAFYQIQGGRPKTVALYTQGRALACAGCARAAWGGGVPAARRVLVLRVDSVSAPARLAVAVLAAAGVALATAFLAFNLHYSKRRSIKLSSPRLNNMTLIGCVLVYTAVALLGVDNANLPPYVPFSAMCIGRVYILSAGFSLAFGSMFAKTYRVHRIFISNRSGVCKTKLLQDTPLISLVCALLVLDGLLVTLWAALDPMQRQLKNLTQEISADDRSVVYQPQIEVCKSQNTTGWLCALYAYKGLLLLVGVYMAWETRNVKISALNDSKYIGISVYSVVITSTSVVVIGTIISERATLAYITITSLILITTTSTLCLLFLPKIVAIRNSKNEDDPVIQSLGLRLECKTRRFVTDETQELHFRIEIQNKVYKREVAALDKEIGRLERLLAEPLESATSSRSSISLHKRTELNTVEEEGRCRSDPDRRTPSITGGLPMLLLSVLPPVIPRASWPSAEHCRGRNSVSFSSQPKLNYRKSQPAIDLYSLCLNKRDGPHGFLSRIRSFFGGSSRPTSRKASTMSIADPTGQSIAAALKMHVGMIAGLVPGNRKHSMVLSCNTLNVPSYPELKLRRESYAKSGPIIRITDDEPTCSKYDRGPQKYIAEPETKVNFVLPTTHKRPMSHENSCEKIKGSPRFPHRISPAASSLTALSGRKTSADSVFSISGMTFDEQRRYSHQNVTNQEAKGKDVLESRWKSTEDARPGPSSRD